MVNESGEQFIRERAKVKAEINGQAGEFVRTVTLREASGITDGVPEWAWSYGDKGRLMRGTLNLFAGRPSAGKSTGARFFAAGYSNGTIGGCFDGSPQNVAYVAAEESIKYMVKPSLRAHGADLTRIVFPEIYFDGQQIRLQSVRDEDLPAKQLVKRNVSIVFVDPIMSTIGSGVDIHRSNETRTHVEPWQRIAEKIGGLVIGIVHLRKQFGTDILGAINGSSAFGEVARGVIAFAADETGEERVLSQTKNAAGENDLAMLYSIEPTTVQTDEGPAEVGKFVPGALSERRASDLLRADNANERLGPISLDVLEAVREIGGPSGPSQVAELVPALDAETAGKYMRRLAKIDMLVKRGRGLYDLPNRKM
jgi:predicted ATP-dependent serine protease